MKTIYETLDGNVFTELADAEKHEQDLLSKVKMWDANSLSTTDTSHAMVVHLAGEYAGAIFKSMILANPAEHVDDDLLDCWVDDEDTGWFFWDEYAESYRYIPDHAITTIAANCNLAQLFLAECDQPQN